MSFKDKDEEEEYFYTSNIGKRERATSVNGGSSIIGNNSSNSIGSKISLGHKNKSINQQMKISFDNIYKFTLSWLNRNRKLSNILYITIVILFLILYLSGAFSHRILGGSKIVIILAANHGGGVMQWKGPQEWALEKASIANKKAYADRHGYDLAIKDVSEKKRYAHEWRESWEKSDILKQVMRQYPRAEWFWWLDLHTYIMEPQLSLEKHIFSRINKKNDIVQRSIEYYNPLNVSVDIPYVDYSKELNLLITQDCGGFSLGSFFIRRSEWTDRLLDFWWDPVFYEQKHMEWEHKEQDALEYIYSQQAWVRSSTAFLPQRMCNSFPPGACAEFAEDSRFFYNEHDRDFVVNMAGCEWGRDCWNEMEVFNALDKKLHAKRFWFF